MRITHLAATLLAGASFVAACQKTETPEQATARMSAETDAARPAIASQLAAYARYYSAGQTDSIMTLHTLDADVMPPHAPSAHGTQAVRQMFAASFQQLPGGHLTLRSEHLGVNGPVAIERGRYNFSAPPAMPADSGKYLTHWHMSGGKWLIAEVIWNSDLPLPMPAAPPAPRR